MAIVGCARCGVRNRVDERAAGAKLAVCGQCGAVLDVNRAADDNRPVTVTDATFEREVLQASGDRPVLLDCWAPWCGPCRMIAPALDQLAAESSGRYRIAKLNVDDNPRVSAQFGVQSIPTMLIFKGGQLIDRIIGAQPKQEIAARLAVHA